MVRAVEIALRVMAEPQSGRLSAPEIARRASP
jgi:hypothetical protein